MSYAWATYIDSESYLLGAVVLIRSLRLWGSKVPFVLMVPNWFPVEAHLGDGCDPEELRIIIRRVEPIRPGGRSGMDFSKVACDRFIRCLNKLHVWSLTEYKYVCWLDADMIVLREGADEVFVEAERSGLAAVGIMAARGCRCNIFGHPGLLCHRELCPFSEGGCRDGKDYFNAGLFVVSPSEEVRSQLAELDYNLPFAEQDAWNEHFAGQVILLDSKYNYLNHLCFAHPDLELEPIIYHFCYGKPWDVLRGKAKAGCGEGPYASWCRYLRTRRYRT